jgi:hypothetical protein
MILVRGSIAAPLTPGETLMTTVRIAHAEPRPGNLGNGNFQTRGYLVVLADDVRHRAVPIWFRGEPGASDLSQLVELARRPAAGIIALDAPQELTARLVGAADARVTGVDIDLTVPEADELSPRDAVARVGLDGSAGARQVTASLGLGLALAAAIGAPVRVPDVVMDRLAVPVNGEDLLTPFLDRLPLNARVRPGQGLPGWPVGTLPAKRPRFEPRNLDFSGGLDRWELDGGAQPAAGPPQPEDYSAAADGRSAVLSSAAPRPAEAAALVQTIFADDYRGATVTFAGDIRTEPLTARAGLRVEVFRHWWRVGAARADHGVTISGHSPWTRHEVTVPIPADADLIRFGITLAGPGQIALRNPQLWRNLEPPREPERVVNSEPRSHPEPGSDPGPRRHPEPRPDAAVPPPPGPGPAGATDRAGRD